jgi:uncharacterized membrane protein
MKKETLFYWIPTALLLLMMVGSGIMYFVQSEEVAKVFIQLGYPVYTMYFNAVAKIIGGIAIIVPQIPRVLKEWAYAGYLFIMLLATQALFMTTPGFPWIMAVSIAIWGLSYWQFTKRA